MRIDLKMINAYFLCYNEHDILNFMVRSMGKIINVGNRIMNTYVYPCVDGYVMIDTGYEHSFKDVERKLNQKNIKLSDIQYVFLTHAHDDH